MLKLLALLPFCICGINGAAVKTICIATGVADWDAADVCSDAAVGGTDGACGTTSADPCHVVVNYDTSNPADAADCGKCVKMTGGSRATTKYGKIIGGQMVDSGDRSWTYAVNENAFGAFGGSETCAASNTVDVTFEFEDCPDELTCWPTDVDEWDPDGKCADADVPDPGHFDCGYSPGAPCTMTKSIPGGAQDGSHCGECVTVTNSDDEVRYGIIIGSEDTTRWKYRMNKPMFEWLGADGSDACAAHHQVAAAKKTEEHTCGISLKCIDDSADDWDPLDHCTVGNIVGSKLACGTTTYDRCHMIRVFDPANDPAPDTETVCGNCLKFTYGRFLAEREPTTLHGKVIGAEQIIGPRAYMVNKVTLTAVLGEEEEANCAEDERYVEVEAEECPVELTCWEADEDDWDTADEDKKCTGVPSPSHESCGATADDPCTVTKAFADGAPNTDHCGKCITIKYDNSKAETELFGVIIGSEKTRRWAYRVNKDTYTNKVSGTGSCAALHEVVPVVSADEANCDGEEPETTLPPVEPETTLPPVEPETTLPPAEPATTAEPSTGEESGAVQMGVVAAVSFILFAV